ncbi:uncharacterized protein [Montipora foliosa]|uniref:uncharacterized protein n=1 Tax=Montipora foliosa TaxID=591990 RepID=UPI0035F1B8DB
MYAQEMKQFYWCRAQCYLRKNHLEDALRDCEEGDRLVPQDGLLLYTKMQVLDKMDKFKDCYTVCNTLIQMKFKVSEVEEKIKLLLPKILKENEKSKELEKPGLPESEDVTSCETSKKQLKKGSKKKGKKRTEGTSDKNLSSSVDNPSNSEHSADTSFALAENKTKEGKVISLSLEEKVEQVNYTEIENENAEFLVKTEEAGSSEGDKAGNDCSQEEKIEAKKKCNDQGGISGAADLNTSFQSSLGEAYPRRILSISERWSCWHSSVCTVNKQLCRSLAKNEDVHVACLVLDATDQETIAATRDGINLIKAAPQPGIREREEHLLSLHSDFPFNADLVIGHGMVSGTAAAIQAKRMGCKRLHIFHALPIEDEDKEQSERDLGLSADFVAGIGPSAVEQWEAVLNRRVFTIIPGLPEVVPRNEIMTPQSRCLVLGNMCAPAVSGLDLVTAAISKCRKRTLPVHLTVVGTEREKVKDLKEEMKTVLCCSNVHVVVKPFDVTHEAVGVEVRGVSVVVIPSTSDEFGMVALEAIAAKVPIVVTSSSGIAKFLHSEFGRQFLKFLCSTGDEMDYVEALASAVDAVLDDRQEAFNLAACLWDKWNSRFTWDVAVSELLQFLSSFGMFSASSPRITKQITLPSQCSDLARKFMEEEVELLNRRRQHVLFLSPENAKESPFIHYFAQVPWAAVLDFDVNSVTTGFLSSCENFCEHMGMKICRILPPSLEEARKKCSVVLLTGIPWVLLEGMPENERSIRENLEWMREFFMALAKTYHAPITFLVLWRSQEETEALCRSLSKILTIVQGSPLYSQVKMVIASTGDTLSSSLEDIADDWKVNVQVISLEDVCNALCQCITFSPFIQENRDFSLPVADPDDPNRVNFKVLPPSSRWVNAEMEVLFTSVGNAPQFGTDDAYHFYRGGLVSWYALQMGYVVERRNWKELKHRIDELLVRTGSVTLQMPHQRGAGGSTSARKILFDYHEKYPCVLLRSVGHAEVAQGIKVLADFCKLPVIILVDRKQEENDYFVVNNLFNILSNDRIPCLILEVTYQKKKEETSLQYPGKSEETSPVRLAEELSFEEAENFVKIYSVQRKDKLSKLRSLLHQGPKQLQIPFYYALTTFEDRFTGLEPFVRDCLENLGATERKILLFLAMAYHYGGNSLSANEFSNLLKAPRREVALLESVLPELTMELLLEEDDKWRPRHDLIAVEMLRQLLTVAGQRGLPAIHVENWKSRLAEAAVECFGHMSYTVVSDMLVLSRIPNDSHFTQLISDIPFEEDAIKLFERAISVFPDDPFFKVHLGRFYSIQKRSAGLPMAIKYTDEGIYCSQSYPRSTRGQFAQMKGMVYSREVSYLIEQRADIRSIANTAQEAVTNFRRAVSIAPDFVNGYIPEVRMMCNVFDFIDKQTGNLFEYVKSADVHPFITHAISDTSNTLECVPDSDEYPYWRMRLACLGRKRFSLEQGEKTLELLYHLRNSGKGSRGSVNRQIVIMRLELCVKSGDSVSSIAAEMIELLNEALKHDTNIEQTMRLWVKIAPFIPVALSEAENKVFHWCSKTKSVRSYLYKLIIACLHLLEGGSSTYAEIMKNAYDDLNAEIKTINRDDVGRCRHPDRPVVWLGKEGRGMGHLVFLSDNISELMDVRMKRSIDSKYTKQLRPLTGLIIKTGPKVGTIKVKQGLDVTFRTDLCEPTPLVSSSFMNKKVQFYLAFTLFGSDAYNVRLVAE